MNNLLKDLLDSEKKKSVLGANWNLGEWSDCFKRIKNPAERDMPNILVGAAALSLDMGEIRQLCGLGIDDSLPNKFKFDKNLVNNDIFKICILSRLIDDEEGRYRYEQSPILSHLINSFNEICNNDIENHNLVLALPWLLAVCKPTIDNLIIHHVVENEILQKALAEIGKEDIPILATRAKDVLLRATGVDDGKTYEVISWWSDKLRGWNPTNLDAPRSTWIGNSQLEFLLRDIGRRASEKLLDVESAGEEILTGSLLANLVNESEFYRNSLPTAIPTLSLDYKSLNRPQEKKHGADLAIRVKISCDDVIATRVHFVQIKKMGANSKGYPSWRIDIPQLGKLMETEQTSTYWLFSNQPGAKVLCVPAGLVRANARRQLSQQTTAISYANVRTAAIDLGNLLCDLVIGMWIGIDLAEDDFCNKVDTFDFIKERYKPSNILTISVGKEQQH